MLHTCNTHNQALEPAPFYACSFLNVFFMVLDSPTSWNLHCNLRLQLPASSSILSGPLCSDCNLTKQCSVSDAVWNHCTKLCDPLTITSSCLGCAAWFCSELKMQPGSLGPLCADPGKALPWAVVLHQGTLWKFRFFPLKCICHQCVVSCSRVTFPAGLV